MKIALTGGTGFVGRNVADHLAAQGHHVTAWLRPGSDRSRLTMSVDDMVPGALGDAEAAERLCSDADAVVHCGWHIPRKSDSGGSDARGSFMTRPEDVAEYYRVNVVGSVQLLEAARRSGVGRFVFVSTGAVHGKTVGEELDEQHPLWPTSIYGAAKAAVETAVHGFAWEEDDNGLCVCTIRPTSVFGVDDPPEQSRFYDLIRRVARDDRVEVSGGGKTVHVDDVALSIAAAITADDHQVRGQTFNCTGGLITSRQVAETAAKILGRDVTIEGDEPTGGKVMRTDKLESIGIRMNVQRRLEQTVRELAATF